MAVITKYVVVRNGVELDREFLVKKEADAYDKMLDAADNLAVYIKDAELQIDVDNETINALSVFLAKNGPEVSRILKGLKPAPQEKRIPDEEAKDPKPTVSEKKKTPVTKAKAKPKNR